MTNDRSPADLESDFATVARLASGAGSPAAAPTTLLHIGDEHAVVLSGHGGKPESAHRLDLGAARIARGFFRHDPPMSREIERAIDYTEDEIMRLGPPAGVSGGLWSTAPALQAWGALSGSTMSIEIVEQWFQRLASASEGHLSALQGLPAGREAAATLLVLREFMHHCGYTTILVVRRFDELAG
jgi:exopolyphosphatase/pppGpp-phosphohydrolase